MYHKRDLFGNIGGGDITVTDSGEGSHRKIEACRINRPHVHLVENTFKLVFTNRSTWNTPSTRSPGREHILLSVHKVIRS